MTEARAEESACEPALAAAKEELLRGDPSEGCARIDELVQGEGCPGELLHLKGLIEARRTAFKSAADWLERAFSLCPDKWEWSNDLGCVYAASGEWRLAAERFSWVLGRVPNDFTALNGYGLALLETGDADGAIESLRRALKIRPGAFAPLLSMGRALARSEQFNEAIGALEEAIRSHPERVEPRVEMARVYAQCRYFKLAVIWWKSVLDAAPEHAEASEGLLAASWDAGEFEETLPLIEQIVREGRATPELRSTWIFSKLHEYGLSAEPLRLECSAFGRELTPAVVRSFDDARRSERRQRRLRIGYLTGEFVNGPPVYFLKPFIGSHDRSAFDIFLYHTRHKDDEATSWYRTLGNWQDCRDRDDEGIRELIEGDGIDILVDPSGFFPENKLGVFAGRAAPVQVSYPHCPVTTGVPAMDYILTDRWTCPEGFERQYTEQAVFLPSGYLAFAPAEEAPGVTELPASVNGFITFGLFQRRLKTNAAFWDAAADVLERCKGSRLMMHQPYYDLEEASSERRRRAIDEFRRRGIAEERISLLGARAHGATLATMGAVDIALDTFPYQGQTTTCECLWQGVPVVALSGEAHVSRVGTGILERVGLGDFSNRSKEEYVRCAVDLANDLPRLAGLRAGMRERLRGSTLLDGRNLAREMETAFEGIWQAWCGG